MDISIYFFNGKWKGEVMSSLLIKCQAKGDCTMYNAIGFQRHKIPMYYNRAYLSITTYP